MRFILHHSDTEKIAELEEGSYAIKTVKDALAVMAGAGELGATRQIVHACDLDADFFILRTGLAGEILQKYMNYGNRIAIVGDFTAVDSRSLRDFILECNRGAYVAFVGDVAEAVRKLDSMK